MAPPVYSAFQSEALSATHCFFSSSATCSKDFSIFWKVTESMPLTCAPSILNSSSISALLAWSSRSVVAANVAGLPSITALYRAPAAPANVSSGSVILCPKTQHCCSGQHFHRWFVGHVTDDEFFVCLPEGKIYVGFHLWWLNGDFMVT